MNLMSTTASAPLKSTTFNLMHHMLFLFTVFCLRRDAMRHFKLRLSVHIATFCGLFLYVNPQCDNVQLLSLCVWCYMAKLGLRASGEEDGNNGGLVLSLEQTQSAARPPRRKKRSRPSGSIKPDRSSREDLEYLLQQWRETCWSVTNLTSSLKLSLWGINRLGRLCRAC